MRRLTPLLVAVLVGGALSATLGAAPALAGPSAGCATSAKADFARVQLYKDADCKGASVIVPKTGDGNRPNFAAFGNFDGSTRSVDDSRSSLAIDRGTCVRLFDGVNYSGLASTNICAAGGVLLWNLDRFDDRSTSMRVCTTSRQADCDAPASSAPAPAPTPPPASGPGAPPAGGFDPDPQGFGGATTAQKKANFYAKMLPLARAVRAEFGVPVSFALAQAASESAYGLKTFGSARNFYGIKCPVGPAGIAIGCTRGGTTEVYDGRRVSTRANFRRYRTALDSMRDMGSLLRRKYSGAFASVGDPNEFARQVQRGGYATDPDYARTIVAIMRVNQLYQYDR